MKIKAKRIKEIIVECKELLDFQKSDLCRHPQLSETGISVKEVLELAKVALKEK